MGQRCTAHLCRARTDLHRHRATDPPTRRITTQSHRARRKSDRSPRLWDKPRLAGASSLVPSVVSERHRLYGELATVREPFGGLFEQHRAGRGGPRLGRWRIRTTSARRPVPLLTRSSGWWNAASSSALRAREGRGDPGLIGSPSGWHPVGSSKWRDGSRTFPRRLRRMGWGDSRREAGADTRIGVRPSLGLKASWCGS
jgi:hypothetical protein